MSDQNETALATSNESFVMRPAGADAARDVVNTKTFYSILKLYPSSANAVKNELIPMNNYGFSPEKDKLEALGREVVVVPITWRFSATEFRLDAKTQKYMFDAYFDNNDPNFLRIQELSKSKDEKVRKGNSCGFDFLVWVPVHKRLMRVQLLNQTNYKIHPKLDGWLGKAVVLGSRRIEANGYVWQGMTASLYSGEQVIMPDAAEARAAAQEFLAVKHETNVAETEEDAVVVPASEATDRG